MFPLIKFINVGVLAFSLLASQSPAVAFDKSSSLCRSLLIDIKRLDNDGKKLHEKYTKEYAVARESGDQTTNLTQTRALLELIENDRSLYLRTLESQKCFTKTELLNLKETLDNINSDASTVKSWLDAQIGIPGRNFYQAYIELPKNLSTPQPWQNCEKKGNKYKNLICKIDKGKLRWVNPKIPADSSKEITWPTGFIDGQVNLIEAKNRIVKYFDENSRVFSSSGDEAIEFMKRTSYPGLFDFNSEQMLKMCRDYKDLQDKASPITVKYTVSVEGIKPNSDFVIVDSSQGQLIVNTKFSGQVFSVPVRLEVNKGDFSDPGTVHLRRVSIINGDVYRFSAC